MAEHNDFGKLGEDIAANYLLNNGFKILERGYRFKHGEVDLIAYKKKCIHFVEVKTRTSDYLGSPVLQVNRAKQKLIIQSAQHYVSQFVNEYEVSFDVIGIVKNSKTEQIEHVIGAFTPLW